jgi:hypothetical protein
VGQKDSSPGSAGFVQRTPSEQRIRPCAAKKPLADLIYSPVNLFFNGVHEIAMLSFLLLFVQDKKKKRHC